MYDPAFMANLYSNINRLREQRQTQPLAGAPSPGVPVMPTRPAIANSLAQRSSSIPMAAGERTVGQKMKVY